MFGGVPRTPGWTKESRDYKISVGNVSEISGKKGTIFNPLQVHHCIPFHLAPEKELDWDNFICVTRWEHFIMCHLGNWKSWNINIKEDAKIWFNKISNRPL